MALRHVIRSKVGLRPFCVAQAVSIEPFVVNGRVNDSTPQRSLVCLPGISSVDWQGTVPGIGSLTRFHMSTTATDPKKPNDEAPKDGADTSSSAVPSESEPSPTATTATTEASAGEAPPPPSSGETSSVVEEFIASTSKSGVGSAQSAVEGGDKLLFFSNRRFYIYATVGSAIMPFTWASVMVYMNLYQPEAQHMHWGWIGSVYAVGGLCGGVAVMGASHMVHKLVLLEGGTHVEITCFNFIGSTQPPVVIPVTMLGLRESPSQRGQVYATVDGSRTALSFDSAGEVDNWALLTHVLGGNIPPSPDNPSESQASLRRKANRAYWKEAKDPQGRSYYYHEITRETRWELPSRFS